MPRRVSGRRLALPTSPLAGSGEVVAHRRPAGLELPVGQALGVGVEPEAGLHAGQVDLEDEPKVAPLSRKKFIKRGARSDHPLSFVFSGGQGILDPLDKPIAALVEERQVEIKF